MCINNTHIVYLDGAYLVARVFSHKARMENVYVKRI